MGRPADPAIPTEGVCPRCGVEFKLTYYQRSRLKLRGQTPYCSQACWMRTHNNPERNAVVARATAEKRGNTLRGRGEGKSYTKRGGRHEHRVVMEQMLDRPLLPGEIVHHTNHLRSPNTPDNLELTNRSEHAKHHLWGKLLSSGYLTDPSVPATLDPSQQEEANDSTSSRNTSE